MGAHFGRLLVAIVASLGLIALGVLSSTLPAWFAVTSVLPLVGYHLFYLWPRARSLGTAEIDSVYYLGFLITVAALAGTAIEIASGRTTDIQPVLLKFGLGLIATGYAVVARLHLQSVGSNSDRGSPEQALDTYVQRSNELLDNLDAAIISIKTLADNALSASASITEKSTKSFEQTVLRTAHAFDAELRTTLISARESVTSVHALLTDTSFVAERNELREALRESAAASRDANSAIEAFAQGARRGTESLGGVHASAVTLTSSADVLTAGLARLTAEQSSLTGVAANILAATEASAVAARSAEATAGSVAGLSATVETAGRAFDTAARSASGTSQQLQALSDASRRLEEAVSTLTAAAAASERFAARIEHVGETLPALASRVQALDAEFGALHGALSTTAGCLEGDVQRSTRAVSMLAERLTGIAQTIIDQTRERHARV